MNVSNAIVLYSREREVWKISDFGLTSEGSTTAASTTVDCSGTPGYRAPELVVDGKEEKEFTNRVDIWALGCILYELAIGKKAFKDDFELVGYQSLPIAAEM